MKDIAKALYECGEDYEKLTTEHDRLREALKTIIEIADRPAVIDIARKALSKKEAKG